MKNGFLKRFMPVLQNLGKSLMTPIAILPGAALLFRFGSHDMLNIPLMAEAGGAVFANLPLLFAVGVAIGFAKDSGIAALSSGVGFVVLTSITKKIDPSIDVGVFGGIVMGAVTAYLYNRYKDVRLPEFLAFFGGNRFVPIITSVAGLFLGLLFGVIWPPIQKGLTDLGYWIEGTGAFGPAIFMVINRALLPFGLHHIPNNFIFFLMGSFEKGGQVFTGDLTRFFQGDPTAGRFLVGFFPIMLAGYPAAALAMIHTAHPSQRKAIRGIMLSAAFTSFLTGITEPIEFAYTFTAPVLYVANIILSALAAFTCNMLGITNGFGFSAGFIDYAINFGLAHKPILLLVVSAVWGLLFYVVFKFLIIKLNLPTPGRIVEDGETSKSNGVVSNV
ncbi:MAG: N-acetylglucosamine system or component [Thermoanaerobacteraceae bacterium]|nr:N-acetylglucosamine system or component [Thermoanaerobacteraceae bacterium]